MNSDSPHMPEDPGPLLSSCSSESNNLLVITRTKDDYDNNKLLIIIKVLPGFILSAFLSLLYFCCWCCDTCQREIKKEFTYCIYLTLIIAFGFAF